MPSKIPKYTVFTDFMNKPILFQSTVYSDVLKFKQLVIRDSNSRQFTH